VTMGTHLEELKHATFCGHKRHIKQERGCRKACARSIGGLPRLGARGGGMIQWAKEHAP
jgi:hypothetical protein